MNIKFRPNLFLETVELEKFKESLDSKGWRKNLLENSESFGLIKNSKTDPNFTNCKVERDLDSDGSKTVKIQPLYAIDQLGRFIYQPEVRQLVVPDDGLWHWLKVSYVVSTQELGTYSISADGTLTDTDGNHILEDILRGQPNFPTKVLLYGSTYNTLMYEVLKVIDTDNAILQHPALTSGGVSAFVPETGLKLKICGTFTPGIATPTLDYYPFEYDACTLSLVTEAVANTRPTSGYSVDTDFYIARVKVTSTDVVIQDKRTEYWESKGSKRSLNISRVSNPLIGVESIKYNHTYTPGDKNIVETAWGMRSDNWTLDVSKNLVTFHGGSLGGKFKTVADFTNGDFNGWRLYTGNGRYSTILDSVKQGGSINLTLDVLDVDNYSADGGDYYTTMTLLAVPDCDTVELRFTPLTTDTVSFMEKIFTFPVNTPLSKSELVVYKNLAQYTVEYRYKTLKEFTEWTSIPSDNVGTVGTRGYYDETSFTESGNLNTDSLDRNRKTYSSTIELTLSPNSLYNFRNSVDKGDLFGVENYTTLTDTVYPLVVGTSKNYLYFTGSINITKNIFFQLPTTSVIEGNKFTFHFNCTTITPTGTPFNIYIILPTGNESIFLKKLRAGDIYEMMNTDGGIRIDFIYDGSQWILSQNYDTGRPYEIVQCDGHRASFFDSTGLGKIQGYFGYAICNGQNGTPDLSGRFLTSEGTYDEGAVTYTYPEGSTGGEAKHQLTIAEMPAHTHQVPVCDYGVNSGKNGTDPDFIRAASPHVVSDSTGGDGLHENRPPYYVLLFVKKLY